MDGRVKKLKKLLSEFRRENSLRWWPDFHMGAVTDDGTVRIHCGYHEFKTRTIAIKLTEWPPFRDFCRIKGAECDLVIRPNDRRMSRMKYTSSRGKYDCRTEVVVRLK